MTTKDVIQNYYASLNAKDSAWQTMWADNSSFSDASEALDAKGKEAIIQSFAPFLKGVVRVEIKRIIAEDDNVCTIVGYDYQNPKGQKLHQDVAEVWQVNDGKLASLVIYFDLTAYRSFMKG